uniref:Uncharacterized protein n=1 Tax=Quercus lobata TaxID=97700 RepID=A0A7N2LN43_QUELO
MVDEQLKGDMEYGIFKDDLKALALRKKGCPNYGKLRQLFAPNIANGALQISLNTPTPDSDEECALGWDETIQTVIASKEDDLKALALRKKGCPNYGKLRQLFAPNIANGALQISLNTPTPDSDEECALGWDETIQTVIASKEDDLKALALRKKGCPNYGKLRQLFAPNIANGALQISLNTPTPDSDEQCALEEELANEAHQPIGKGKKVAKKGDRASKMTMVLQEYTALAREIFSNKKGRSIGSSDHGAQSTGGGDPCPFGRAFEVLNLYEDLDDDTYVNISEVLQKKEKMVVFMGMPEHRWRRWMECYANQPND